MVNIPDFDNALSNSKYPTCLKQGNFISEYQVKHPCLKYVDIMQILKTNEKANRTNYKSYVFHNLRNTCEVLSQFKKDLRMILIQSYICSYLIRYS